MAGRDVLVSKFVTHPDTKQKIAVAAIGWSFAKLDAQERVEKVLRSKGRENPAVVVPEKPTPKAQRPATLREGQTYDF